MFKKIYERFDDLKEYIRTQIDFLVSMCNDIRYDVRWIKTKTAEMPKITRMEKTIESQQRTIETLTDLLKDKHNEGLFFYCKYGEAPIIFKDGNELTSKAIRSLDISWDRDDCPEININM